MKMMKEANKSSRTEIVIILIIIKTSILNLQRRS